MKRSILLATIILLALMVRQVRAEMAICMHSSDQFLPAVSGNTGPRSQSRRSAACRKATRSALSAGVGPVVDRETASRQA